ncbi:M23 family metallopeptidase [Streptomyces pacificus]|uniref:Peptidoglycan DD-metalloendopeptidase family protein n=1 Tax=Streptomyces pacificus TaxID=2705029 RepID=A0A6A0B098_9ACTN|nr:peptidoglycan DD-metalloendopeptidase family protein [Streptomyces pacificus]GFH38125.1 peptidoglycan DD-metalloendopeptidase family protein [Streptomyces pacificus]
MPGKGKHRRPKASPFRRGLIAAGTGGAAIAIPFTGAAGAHATGQSAPTGQSVSAGQSAPAGYAAPAPQRAASPQAPRTGKAAGLYTVVPGDHLSKIAVEQQVAGGWQRLYAHNRAAVGDNPSLIHPGLELSLHGESKARSAPEPQAKSDRTAGTPAKARNQPTAQREAASADSTPRAAAAPSAAPVQAPAAGTVARNAPSGYVAPVNGGVGTAYRAAGAMWSSGYHTGVDFVAPTGTSVKAVGPGAVVSAGWSGAYGNEVVIKHDDGTYSQYAHLSQLSVSSGEAVTGGRQIGLSGSTGNSTGPHLHFEVRTGPGYGSDIDPLAYLRRHGVVI